MAFSSMPDWLEPMAATLTQERFTGPDWIFERKFDGIRLLAFKHGADVRLYLAQPPAAERCPAVAAAVARAAGRRRDPRRRGDRGTARERLPRVRRPVARRARRHVAAARGAPRAAAGAAARAAAAARRSCSTTPSRGSARAREGWEGVIAKRRDSPYEHRRSPHWLKMKCEATQELVVGGFTDPQGTRVGLGALLVGYFDGDDFVFAGKVGTGFDTKLLLELRAASTRSRSRVAVHQGRRACRACARTGCGPEIVVQVAFIEWTAHGKLRHPRLLGVRFDKAARRSSRRTAVITHPEKVLFPDDGITKGELAAYYEPIAPVMLPHMRGRPVTMERYPAGHRREGVLAEGRLEGLSGVARARRGAEEGRHRPPSARHRHAIAAVAREPEQHHAARLDVARARPVPSRPLRLRSRSVAETSRRCCARRRSACATCSTSSACQAGSRPPARRAFTSSCRSTARRRSDDVARLRATRSGTLLVEPRPEHLTQEFSKADRGGRIFVDTGRNGYSATFAAAYAVRAKPGAPVSRRAPGRKSSAATSVRRRSRCGTCRPGSRRLATSGPTCGGAGDRWLARRRSYVNSVAEDLQLVLSPRTPRECPSP